MPTRGHHARRSRAPRDGASWPPARSTDHHRRDRLGDGRGGHRQVMPELVDAVVLVGERLRPRAQVLSSSDSGAHSVTTRIVSTANSRNTGRSSPAGRGGARLRSHPCPCESGAPRGALSRESMPPQGRRRRIGPGRGDTRAAWAISGCHQGWCGIISTSGTGHAVHSRAWPLFKGDPVSRTRSRWSAAPMAAVVATLLVAAGCGDVEVNSKAGEDKAEASPRHPAPAEVDTCAGEGNWLLGSAPPAAPTRENTTTTYVTYNPSTGQATPASPGRQGRDHHAGAGAPARERRPRLGHPRHRRPPSGGEERPAHGLLARRRHHEGHRHPRAHRQGRRDADRAGPSTPSGPTRCAWSTPRTGCGR